MPPHLHFFLLLSLWVFLEDRDSCLKMYIYPTTGQWRLSYSRSRIEPFLFPFLAKNGHLTKCCTLWTFRFHSSPKNIVTFCALIKPTHGYPKQDRIMYVEWPKLTTYYWNQFGLFLCVCAPSIIGLVLMPSSTLPLLVEQLVTFRVGWMVWPMVCPVG